MCGIAGLIATPEAPAPETAVLGALEQCIAHRGPDGSGHTVVGRVALVHNRLAIIDLATGDQPMFTEGGRIAISGPSAKLREDPAVQAAYLGI